MADADVDTFSGDELKDYIERVADLLDTDLRNRGVELNQRPMMAAQQFVDHFIVSLSEAPKENYLVTRSFAVIFAHFTAWYKDRYGEAFQNFDTGGNAVVLAEVRGAVVEVRVPLTRSEVEEEGVTAWLIFPAQVDPCENPLKWLHHAPPLAGLDAKSIAKIRRDISKAAGDIRTIRIFLMGPGKDNDVIHGLLRGVVSDLEASAHLILKRDAAGRQGAMWPMHIACEKVLKALALQQNGSFREIHNLFELFDDVKDHLPAGLRTKLRDIPVDRAQMDARYGQASPPSEIQAYKAYKAALAFVAGVARNLKADLYVANARFLLKRAPWTEFLKDS